jgi:hypothetical protein
MSRLPIPQSFLQGLSTGSAAGSAADEAALEKGRQGIQRAGLGVEKERLGLERDKMGAAKEQAAADREAQLEGARMQQEGYARLNQTQRDIAAGEQQVARERITAEKVQHAEVTRRMEEGAKRAEALELQKLKIIRADERESRKQQASRDTMLLQMEMENARLGRGMAAMDALKTTEDERLEEIQTQLDLQLRQQLGPEIDAVNAATEAVSRGLSEVVGLVGAEINAESPIKRQRRGETRFTQSLLNINQGLATTFGFDPMAFVGPSGPIRLGQAIGGSNTQVRSALVDKNAIMAGIINPNAVTIDTHLGDNRMVLNEQAIALVANMSPAERENAVFSRFAGTLASRMADSLTERFPVSDVAGLASGLENILRTAQSLKGVDVLNPEARIAAFNQLKTAAQTVESRHNIPVAALLNGILAGADALSKSTNEAEADLLQLQQAATNPGEEAIAQVNFDFMRSVRQVGGITASLMMGRQMTFRDMKAAQDVITVDLLNKYVDLRSKHGDVAAREQMSAMLLSNPSVPGDVLDDLDRMMGRLAPQSERVGEVKSQLAEALREYRAAERRVQDSQFDDMQKFLSEQPIGGEGDVLLEEWMTTHAE